MLIKSLKFPFIFSLAFSGALLASHANAAYPSGTKADYGQAVPANTVDYTVKVNDATKWVNVNNGDTVRFDVNGKAFAWHFDIYGNEKIVKLSEIAPSGTDTGAVKIYVGPNPLYMN